MAYTDYLDTVQKVYIGYYQRAADPGGLIYWAAKLDARGGDLNEIIEAFANCPESQALYGTIDSTTIAASVTSIYNALFDRNPEASGLAYWVDGFNSGEFTAATIMLEILNGAQGEDRLAVENKLTASNLFTTTIDPGLDGRDYQATYSGDADAASGRTFLTTVTWNPVTVPNQSETTDYIKTNIADTGDPITTVPSGQTYTLTTGTNNFTGTSGDDNFDAGLSTESLQTLNSSDRLDGGLGNDSLQAVVNGSVTPAALTSIESVLLTAITSAATVDLTNATGLTSVANQASTSALTLSGLSKAVAVTVQDTSTAGQVITYNDVTGSADAATVTIKNVTGAASLTVAGVETLTLASDGSSANVLATLTTANTTRLNVTGANALNVGTLGSTILTLDASGHTSTGAGVTAIMAGTSASTVTGGSGNDSITFGSSGAADSINAGAGNDTIIFTANFTVADTINGGDGTADALRAINSDLVTASASTPTTYTVTGVETIQSTTTSAGGVSINAVNVSATATRMNLAHLTGTNVTGAGADSIVGGAGSFTVGLGSSVAATGTLGGSLTVTDTGTGITDSLTIVNSEIASGTGLNANVYNANNIIVNGYETVTINTGSVAASAANTLGTITVTGDVGGTTAETVNFTGANIVTAGVITADIVDASGLTAAGTTAAPTITMVTGSTATKVTGSGGIDILFGHTTLASSVNGGVGNDTITGGSGNDTLLGGEGNDTITTGGGAGDSVDGGVGNDTIIATLTAGNVMTGGDGTDTLSLAAVATAANATGVSGFERLRLTAAFTQDMAVFLDNSTFTRIEGGVAGSSVFTNVGSGITTLATTVAGNTSSVARLVDTSSNSLTVSLLTAATTDLITANNEETINLSSSSTGAVTLTTLTDTDLHTLNITGSGAVTIGTLSANSTTVGTVLTIDGSANTGGISVSAANSIIVGNITGSATAANTLTGTGGVDTIVGGSAADTIAGGLGADILTGGASADTFRVTSQVTNFTGGAPSSTVFETITDYALNSDIIDDTTAAFILSTDAGTSASAGVAGISAAGIATFNIADSTLALRIAAVNAGLNSGTETTGQIAAFEFGNDTYVFIDNAANNAVTALDGLIKLTGVTGVTSLGITGGNLTVGGTAPVSFTLAVLGAETITGTSGDDTITGTYVQGGTGTFNTTDVIAGNGGTDTLSFTDAVAEAMTVADAYWAGVTGIEKIVTAQSAAGVTTINTGANFNTAFATAGVDLTAQTLLGAINIDMATVPFTGAATLTTTGIGAGAHTITTGSGAATVTATSQAAGSQTIKGVGLTTVEATIIGAGDQTIGDGGGNGINLVTVTATIGGAGDQTITSTSGSNVTVNATAAAGAQTIVTAGGADSVTLTTAAGQLTTITTNAGNDTIVASLGTDLITGGAGTDVMTGGAGVDTFVFTTVTDSNAATAGAIDRILDFVGGSDKLKVGVNGSELNSETFGGTAYAAMDTITELNALLNSATGTSSAKFDGAGNDVAKLTTSDARILVAIDVNGDGNFTAADVVVELTGLTGVFAFGDVIV